MPGCQVVFNRPAEEALAALSDAAEEVGEAEVLPGDLTVAVMAPSIARVVRVVERAFESLLADGRPLVCGLTLSEG